MALASEIIRRAYRESNLIPIGTTPTAAQVTEALESLNTLLLSTVGNEAGTTFTELIIGGDFDESAEMPAYVPRNTRLVLQLDGLIEVGLDPKPHEGQRVAIVDTLGNLSTNTITLNANGRLIEGASQVTCSTDFMSRQWMYRADTGNWVRISSLIDADPMPFPTEFDDYFITMLAVRINPRFSQTLGPETLTALSRSRSQLRARYGNVVKMESDVKSWDLMANRHRYTTSPTENFDTGEIG